MMLLHIDKFMILLFALGLASSVAKVNMQNEIYRIAKVSKSEKATTSTSSHELEHVHVRKLRCKRGVCRYI